MKIIVLTQDELQKLTEEMILSGYNVVIPDKDNVYFQAIASAKELVLNSMIRPSAVSLKEYYFPKSETLFYYKKNKDEFELTDPAEEDKKTVVIGARPCDAAALPVLSKVFNWDYKDDFFNKRADNTIVIGMACSFRDENCFCTSVGLSPASEKGSDLFLTLLNENEYTLKTLSSKGEAFISSFPSLAGKTIEEQPFKEFTGPPKRFETAEIKGWLDKNFNHPLWDQLGENCLGCALCAFVCPVCHCFDIVDEECGASCGRRAKNWDACQFELFTKHASGHNPRDQQGKRYRQRISHKFKYYIDKFDEILCTGCGRCSRGCPVSTDIALILEDISQLAKNN